MTTNATKPLASPPVAESTVWHRMNCASWFNDQGQEVNGEDCTCGLRYRIQLQTEQTMHAAWRKRAEEAEAKLATPTPEGTGWIDVRQELPPMTERIPQSKLSYSKDLLVWLGDTWSAAYYAQFDGKAPDWISVHANQFKAGSVTHWMLPAAPAEPGTEGDQK